MSVVRSAVCSDEVPSSGNVALRDDGALEALASLRAFPGLEFTLVKLPDLECRSPMGVVLPSAPPPEWYRASVSSSS